MSEIEDRFDRLRVDVPKALKYHEEEVAPQDKDAILADELHSWAVSDSCKRVFLPFLKRMIRIEQDEERNAVRSHPDICYHMGRRDFGRDLLAEFHKWADKAEAPADESED